MGEDGETHNGRCAYLRHLPGIVLMAPGNGAELASMLKTALALNCPAAIRYPRGKAHEPLPQDPDVLPLGKGLLLKEGSDILILAAGCMVPEALKAHELLLKEGIQSCIINPRFIKPLDRELICQWGVECGKILTVEDHLLAGGFGSAVLELLEEEGIKGVCLKRLGFQTRFTEG